MLKLNTTVLIWSTLNVYIAVRIAKSNWIVPLRNGRNKGRRTRAPKQIFQILRRFVRRRIISWRIRHATETWIFRGRSKRAMYHNQRSWTKLGIRAINQRNCRLGWQQYYFWMQREKTFNNHGPLANQSGSWTGQRFATWTKVRLKFWNSKSKWSWRHLELQRKWDGF